MSPAERIEELERELRERKITRSRVWRADLRCEECGEVAVERLVAMRGDRLVCAKHGAQPCIWSERL